MFKWTPEKEKAAALLALGEATVAEVAAQVGVTERAVYRWKTEPEFQKRVSQSVEEIRKRILKSGIADRMRRVERLDRRWQAIDSLIRARAEEMAGKVAGGETGLLVGEQKSIGSGQLASIVEVFKPDTALLKEERDLAKQAAQELGQWSEKHEFSNLSDEELVARARELLGGE